MKTMLFVSTLVISSFAQADCVLSSEALKTFQSLEVRGCESEPASICVFATDRNGQTEVDVQVAKACLPSGDACAFEGEKFDLAYYQPRASWTEPQPGFAYVRAAGSEAVLAKCQF